MNSNEIPDVYGSMLLINIIFGLNQLF